ncbi:MAG: ChaN family lipoprotein [bacterium]
MRSKIDPASRLKRTGFLLVLLGSVFYAAQAFPSANEATLNYTLNVTLDIDHSKITGVARIPVSKGQELKFSTGRLRILRASLDQKELAVPKQDETLRILPPYEGILEIEYEGLFQESPSRFQFGEPSSIIAGQGVFLTGSWYPKPEQLCLYHLTASLPEGYEVVSEAETINKVTKDGKAVFTFSFPHPLGSLDLIASNRYKVVKEDFRGVEVYVYFFPEDSDLIPTYLEHTKKYLSLYNQLLLPFPYKRFSVVENFLPTGYSMPTFTLLGQEVVRLPFIPETSLGHEILHQWFGNLVYIDYAKGNWAEGLTTFLADHLYEEEKGRGVEYRKGMLINYQSYVNEKNEFPLREFIERTDEASEAIGYGKALMVFQMLKRMVGEKRFYEAIKYFIEQNRFRRASWEDIEEAFEKFYQKKLDWFFRRWIDGKGLPDIHLVEVKVIPSGAKFEVSFTVTQKGRVFILDVPVVAHSDLGKTTAVFHLQGEKEQLKMIVNDAPDRISVDEDYDVARMLSIDEFPPVIARLVGDENRMIVLPPRGVEIFQDVIDRFKGKGVSLSEPEQIKHIEPGTSSLIILGADNPVVAKLYGSVIVRGGFGVLMKENPWNRWKVVGIFNARSKEEVGAAFQKIFHYGKYSAVSFDHGVNVYKEIDQSTRGITEELLKKAVAVEISTLKTLPDVVAHGAGKKIVYVGETHYLFPDHVMELDIIKDLHKRGRPIAIGMEMFQRPFQKVLDDYIGGKIDEAEFLKGTEYFKRWAFDYHLYRPILLYARSENIPVIALNIPQEIVDKVFRSGLDSLSEEERKSVPSQMDFSDEAYKDRLKKVFLEHRDIENFKTSSFDFFYQAQILWDEAMAESIDQFLRTHPDDQMVVLAGSGHLAYGSGIPKRTARRNGYDYAIILDNAALEKGIADFVLFPGDIPGVTSPMLMVFLREEAGKVEIAGFSQESASEKAGMKVGDTLLAIDHTPIHTIDDVKIDLLARKKGEKVRVRVLRKGFLGSREVNFDVVLR